jgi:heme/copper-type cytochrome/quinol oxidase subunit 2
MNTALTLACATCINTEDSTGVVAANGAVFVMMGALGIIFLMVSGVLISFIRRAKKFAAEQDGAA